MDQTSASSTLAGRPERDAMDKMQPINDGHEERGHVARCAICGVRGVWMDTDCGIVNNEGTEIAVDLGTDLVPLLAGTTAGHDTDNLYCENCAEAEDE